MAVALVDVGTGGGVPSEVVPAALLGVRSKEATVLIKVFW